MKKGVKVGWSMVWVATALSVGTVSMAAGNMDGGFTSEELLGRMLYFDKNLSSPPGQACASCHLPQAGFADPDQGLPVSEGVIDGRFGGRNSPTSGYASFSPTFSKDAVTGEYVGGQFWDGRAATLKEQAKGPFLNPVEMNNTEEGLVDAVRNSRYADTFRSVYGPTSLDDVPTAFELIAQATAAFERSKQLNRFNSKYDSFLKNQVQLTSSEANGLMLFNQKCSECHASSSTGGTAAVFSSFTYQNIGVPSNPTVIALAGLPSDHVDLGLGAIVNEPEQYGKFKVPTLRNIALTAPYTHNGYFTTLKDVVHFHNTRADGTWPAPEYPDTVTAKTGSMGLGDAEENDIVAFLQTLSDTFPAR
uniref:Cytochrome-c peroxidase n=1 Tax=Geobacter sp. (strain M21) TaxID=443144 RepID=C6DYR6_GEOSM